jgi:hypothetical protein
MRGKAGHAVAAGVLVACALAPALAAGAAPPQPQAVRARAYWYEEARVVAREIIARQYDPVESVVVVRGRTTRLLEPRPQPGENYRSEGGEVLTWVSQDCYVTPPPAAPSADPNSATKLYIPTCKGGNLRPGASKDAPISVEDLEQKVRQRQSPQR